MPIPGALSRILPHPAGYKYYKFQTGSREKKIAAPRDRGRVQNACAGMKGDVNRVRLNTREDRAAIGSRSKKNEKKKCSKKFFRELRTHARGAPAQSTADAAQGFGC